MLTGNEDRPFAAESAREDFYEALLGSMTEGVSLSTEDGVITYVNPAEERMFGYLPGELIGQHVSAQNAYPPEENERRVAEVIAHLKDHGFWEGEWLNRRKDGSAFVTASRITAVDYGNARHWLCVQRDVSATRAAETALAESEQRFRLAAKAAGIGTWDLDLTTGRGRWDEVAVDICNAGRPDFDEEDWERICHPDDSHVTREIFLSALAPDGPPYAAEFRASSPAEDGGTRWLESNGLVLRDQAGLPVRALGIVRDVTDHRRSEERLRSSEAKFRLMADSAPILIWVNNPDGGCEFVNHAYLRFFGKKLDEVLGFGWLPSAHPDDGEAYISAYLKAVEERRPFTAEARFHAADGSYRWLHSVAEPRLSTDGQYLGHVGVSSDVTAQKEAQDRQAGLIEELNHRVKNTLSIVQSIAHQSLRQASAESDSIAKFEGRLLALATAHRLLTEQKWQHASMQEIIRATVTPFGAERFTISGDDRAVHPQTAVNLSLAINELATNAAKYGALSNDQGRVTISSALQDDGLELVWREVGGPPVTAPSGRGFGTRMIERVLASEMKGSGQIDFATEGLVCTIRTAAL